MTILIKFWLQIYIIQSSICYNPALSTLNIKNNFLVKIHISETRWWLLSTWNGQKEKWWKKIFFCFSKKRKDFKLEIADKGKWLQVLLNSNCLFSTEVSTATTYDRLNSLIRIILLILDQFNTKNIQITDILTRSFFTTILR